MTWASLVAMSILARYRLWASLDAMYYAHPWILQPMGITVRYGLWASLNGRDINCSIAENVKYKDKKKVKLN